MRNFKLSPKKHTLLLLVVIGCAAAQTCEYPCILNNGCACNHSLAHQGADGQTYGTCDKCDIGWTGYDCASNVSPCVNGGTLQPDGSCVCLYSWTGAHCGSQQCVNSVGGVGPDSIVPVDYKDNVCDKCQPGYSGIACEMCSQDSQCNYPGDTCFTDLLYHVGERKVIECDIVDSTWIAILGEGRDIKGKAKMQCDGYLSGCYISIWRIEPNDAYFDPFMYCALSDCTSTTEQGATNTTITPMSTFATPIRYTFQALMLAALAVLQIASFFHMKSSHRSILFAVLGITIIALLGAQIGFSSVYAHDDVDVTIVNETVASYVCKNTNCTCAKDPPDGSYQPFCIGSIAGMYFIPFLAGTSSLICNTVTGQCTFDQQNLGGAPINLQCTASECSNQTVALPDFDIGGQTSTVVYSLAGVAAFVGLIIGSYIFSKAHGRVLAAEFHRNFDAVESRRNSRAPGTPLNNEPDAAAAAVTSPFLIHHQRTVSYNSAVKVTPPTERLHVQVNNLKYFVKGRDDPVLGEVACPGQQFEVFCERPR
ncbi:membrane-associated protein, putative [Bodo saltans]|uniref:Membrane-associated protein, putative n=1 Tax=Bodo saltans TaxID=75058 RepID=A0A0S4JAI4_BODSA|nr:membrane-associated protein, putative [Bodo saltans]|eukprot:CUG86001.1 membrane-associated protein, putative [Bodo saltans]